MEVNVNCKSVMKIDIDSGEAFRLLVKTLHMDFILDDDYEYYTYSNDNGDCSVYRMVNGHDETVDDRGDLYNALMETAKCIFPNL